MPSSCSRDFLALCSTSTSPASHVHLIERQTTTNKDQTTIKTLKMIEITCNDRLGKKIRVKCNPSDTIGDLKRLIAAQTGTRHDKLMLKKWYVIYKDHITLEDYEIKDGMNLELYYQ